MIGKKVDENGSDTIESWIYAPIPVRCLQQDCHMAMRNYLILNVDRCVVKSFEKDDL
jgi:hypothetical protein